MAGGDGRSRRARALRTRDTPPHPIPGSTCLSTTSDSRGDVASFADFRVSAATRQALAEMGITTPTPVQAATLPALLDGRDVIGQARTGSGKTLAFGIPGIEMADPRQRDVQVLILTPTRELAVQVGDVLEAVGKRKGLRVGLVFGGRPIGPQRTMLKEGVQIVVGTPGRVMDLLNQGALWLHKVRLLVLDEADEMLDRGFAPDVERIIARTTTARQTAFFSATLPDWVLKTAEKHLDEPEMISVDPNPEDVAPIEHIAYDVANGDKLWALRDLLDHRGDGTIIVFGRTKHGVRKLGKQLQAAGYPVGALEGGLSQNNRDRVMEAFRAGTVQILVATNVAARGLDIDHVAAVVNIELPETSELLTHRIGRTGRMGRRGQAITLLGPEDGAKWRQLEKGLGRRIPRAPWPGGQAALAATPEDLARALPADEPAAARSGGGQRSRGGSGSGRPATSAPAAQAPGAPRPPRQPRSPRPATASPAPRVATTAVIERPAPQSAPAGDAADGSAAGDPARRRRRRRGGRGRSGAGAAPAAATE
jgi:ATP-dependent RNA helicase DeaD